MDTCLLKLNYTEFAAMKKTTKRQKMFSGLSRRFLMPGAASLLLLLLPPLLYAADNSPIRVEAKPDAELLKSGEKLRVVVDFEYPEERVLAGYMLGAYLPYVPKAFPECAGIKVKVHKQARWSSLAISAWKWFKEEERKAKRHVFEFDTENWPPGDYKLELRGLFRLQPSSAETDLYRSGYFYLSITDP